MGNPGRIPWVLQKMGEEAADAKASTAAPKKRGTKKRSVLAPALGLGAAGLLMGAQGADAATELSQLAASDSRLGIILTLFVPVIGWALFNVAGPAFAQLDVSQSGAGGCIQSARWHWPLVSG